VQLTTDLGLTRQIRFDGFKQYQELPVYFGLAKTFLHASTVEQWGLVVNEAMAAGLPVVISERCGCVPELVHNGVNGFAINPADQPALTQIMVNLTNGTYNPEKMGEASRRIVGKLNTDLFGQGLNQAATVAVQKPVKRGGLVTKWLLKFLMSR
jgi:glycosyltransferase involved in cell wall biosynthesis